MTTVAKADKSRLTIRGVQDGHRYLVTEQPGGWFVSPERQVRPKRRGLSGSELARLWNDRKPLGPDLGGEIADNIQAVRKAK